jgi:xylulokinase
MRDLAVGIDIGTTSVKAIVMDSNGDIPFENSIAHDLISPKPGFAEEDANIWWESSKQLLAEIASKFSHSRFASVGFSGMVPTLIPLNSKGTPLYHSIQQNDARSVREISWYKGKIDEQAYFERTGNTINQQVLFPKIEWLRRNEPKVWEQVRWISGSYSYCTYKLTGEMHVELNWALESGLWDIHKKTWDEQVISIANISTTMLPPVKEPSEVVGYTTKEVEGETSFPAGIPVIAGSADHVASALSCGVREQGDLLLKMGGAGDILFSMGELKTDKRLFIDYHDIPGFYLLNGCMASSGSLVKWFMKELSSENYGELDRGASLLGPGSDGLIALPYFIGEKTPIFDVNARGVFFGLSLYHTKYHMFRAIMESVAFGFMHHIEVIRDMGFDVKRVFLSNGGSKSDQWKKIVLDAVGYPATYIQHHPGSSLGSAVLAADAVGMTKDLSALEKFLTHGITIDYSPEHHEKYVQYFELYKKLYIQLKPLFEQRAVLEQGGLV